VRLAPRIAPPNDVADRRFPAVASLHHPGCRAPLWNDSGVITAVSDISPLSYVTASVVLLPLGRNGREE
jgi:hypothetical protein